VIIKARVDIEAVLEPKADPVLVPGTSKENSSNE
jgi:hypothetical protein